VSDCRRCGGMKLDVFVAQPWSEAVMCAQCAGLSRWHIEQIVHQLREVSTEALVIELESRHFVFQRVGVGLDARLAERFYASTPPESSPPEGSILQTSHKQNRP
jgi:hypothetical protein